jgi:cobaltochelatase CobN
MDHSRPDHPQALTLKEEIGKVVRARVTNPKWINAMQRHGHKGGFEMAATVTYLVAFAATTSQVDNSHFDRVFEAFLGDQSVIDFLLENNPDALREICEKLTLALDRELWTTRHNHARTSLQEHLSALNA